MSGKDMQIRPCGLWWDYCDGKCTVCGKWQTWTTDSSTALRMTRTDPSTPLRSAQDDRMGG